MIYYDCIRSHEKDEAYPEDENLIRSELIMRSLQAYLKKYPDTIINIDGEHKLYDKQDIEAAAALPITDEWFYDMEPHLTTEVVSRSGPYMVYRTGEV